jgi:hypothetical protein
MTDQNKNTKSLLLLSTAILFLIFPFSGLSQSLNVQIDVAPEVQTTVVKDLDFGQVIAGLGSQSIPAGSPNMGIFRVRALRTQSVILQMDADEELIHENPDILDSIPVELQAAYTNFGMEDFELSTPMNNLGESIVLESSNSNPSSEWTSLYIYIFGNVDIGNVREGVYTGEVVLTVIYE